MQPISFFLQVYIIIDAQSLINNKITIFTRTSVQMSIIDTRRSEKNWVEEGEERRYSLCFLIHDFDKCFKPSCPKRGTIRAEGSFGDFRAFLSQNDLYNLQHSGNCLSWRRKRYSHLIHCRLDIALSNIIQAGFLRIKATTYGMRDRITSQLLPTLITK